MSATASTDSRKRARALSRIVSAKALRLRSRVATKFRETGRRDFQLRELETDTNPKSTQSRTTEHLNRLNSAGPTPEMALLFSLSRKCGHEITFRPHRQLFPNVEIRSGNHEQIEGLVMLNFNFLDAKFLPVTRQSSVVIPGIPEILRHEARPRKR